MRPATYFRNDELPAYRRPVTIDGVAPDLDVDYEDLTLTLKSRVTGEVVLEKTNGLSGAGVGTFNANWTVGDLDLEPGLYSLQVTAKRAEDGREWTLDDLLRILDRNV